jgi:N-acetylglucosaminyldiphosphoundecaprenol N-acetyl-beta-D-mannosaminyltransferase
MASILHVMPLSLTEHSVDSRVQFLGAVFDLLPIEDVLAQLKRRTVNDSFEYIVTPNVDHVVRLNQRVDLVPIYQKAWMSWCDSRPVRRLARLLGIPMPHLNGTTMMEQLFASVLRPGDSLLAFVANEGVLEALKRSFPQYQWSGTCPPYGFERDPTTLTALVEFALNHPSRFVFIGVGSPRSEILAARIAETNTAKGTAFCIGSALEFIIGIKVRAPSCFRRFGLEWLHRLLREPGRLWRRYAFCLLPLVRLFLRELVGQRRRRQ